MNYTLHSSSPASRPASTDVTSGGRAASRLWKRYLRVAAAIAGVIGNTMLTVIYFVLLPPFAWLAKRAERREPPGWRRDRARAQRRRRRSQY